MTEILIPKKNVILDATMFNTFISCEQKLDLAFNHSFVPIAGKSHGLECGSIVHKILEVYYDHLIKGFKRDIAIANGMIAGEMYYHGCSNCIAIDGACEEHEDEAFLGCKNVPLENMSKPFRRTGFTWIVETMEAYFEHYRNEHWIPLECEKVRGKILYEDDEIRILWKAKIDVSVDTNQGIVPVDHKTMSQDRLSSPLNNQFMGQCLVSETKMMIVNKIGFQVSKKPEERLRRLVMSYSPAKLIEWQSQTLPRHVYNYLNCIETGYWPMRHTHCEDKYGKCQFHDVCGMDPILREDELRTNFMVGEKWDPS